MTSTSASNAEFETCFKSVLEGLLEYHPALRIANVVGRLRAQLSPTWTPGASAQSDCETLRDLVEAKLPAIVTRLAQQLFTVTMNIEMTDEKGLYKAALARAKSSGLSEDDADQQLITDGVINPIACLSFVFAIDTGKRYGGIEVHSTNIVRNDSD